MRTKLLFAAMLLLLVHDLWAQPQPRVSEIDRIRLAEAFRVGELLGNRVWDDWDKAPFAVLHEHFHQLQDSQPNYYVEVEALNLSRGDQTGMWMLNYPFPYSTPAVQKQFADLSRLLAKMISAQEPGEAAGGLADYLKMRRKFETLLNRDDYAYFSFQLWKEGIARYTEYRIARLAAQEYQPGEKYLALRDYRPFAELADELLKNILRELTTLTLDEYQRELFYPFGAAEALLLDSVNPKWQSHYFADKFFVERYFDAGR